MGRSGQDGRGQRRERRQGEGAQRRENERGVEGAGCSREGDNSCALVSNGSKQTPGSGRLCSSVSCSNSSVEVSTAAPHTLPNQAFHAQGLQCKDLTKLKRTTVHSSSTAKFTPHKHDAIVARLSGGTAFDFAPHGDPTIYLVATDDGHIHQVRLRARPYACASACAHPGQSSCANERSLKRER